MRCHISVLINKNPYTSTYCYEPLNDDGECPIHGQQVYVKPDWMSDEQWKESWQRLGKKIPSCTKIVKP